MERQRPKSEKWSFLNEIRKHPLYGAFSALGGFLIGVVAVMTFLFGPGVFHHETPQPITVLVQPSTIPSATMSTNNGNSIVTTDPIYSSLAAYLTRIQSLRDDPVGTEQFWKDTTGKAVSWRVYITSIDLAQDDEMIFFNAGDSDDLTNHFAATGTRTSFDAKLRMLKPHDWVLVQGNLTGDHRWIRLTDIHRQ